MGRPKTKVTEDLQPKKKRGRPKSLIPKVPAEREPRRRGRPLGERKRWMQREAEASSAVATSRNGFTLPTECWIRKEDLAAAQPTYRQVRPRVVAKMVLRAWPEGGGDVWFSKGMAEAYWRDVPDGQTCSIVLPKKVAGDWTLRRPRIGLTQVVVDAEGRIMPTEARIKKVVRLTKSQNEQFKKRCQEFQLTEGEAIRIALAAYGLIPQFDYAP